MPILQRKKQRHGRSGDLLRVPILVSREVVLLQAQARDFSKAGSSQRYHCRLPWSNSHNL